MSRRDGDAGLTPELLLRAYAAGIFPMAECRDDDHVFWVDPQTRGVMPLETFHVPRRLKKTVRQDRYEIRVNSAFTEVINGCAARSRGRDDTWINGPIERAVVELHQMGFAHSVESWLDGRLVGGLYGIALRGAFFGESMFSTETDASKVALVHLVARLKWARFRLLDTQFVTDHLKRFGVEEIPARVYLERLEEALKHQCQFPLAMIPQETEAALDAVLD